MTKTEFLQEIERVIITQMIKKVNLMMSQPKASFLSTSLMMKLEPTFLAVENDNVSVPKKTTLEDFDECFISYVPFDSPSTIVFELHYSNKKDLKRILSLAEKNVDFFAFNYIKHLHGTVGQVNTSAYIQSALSLAKDYAGPYNIAAVAIDRMLNHKAIATLKAAGVPYHEFQAIVETSSQPLNETIQSLLPDATRLKAVKIPKWVKKARVLASHHITGEINVNKFTPDQNSFGYQSSSSKQDVRIVDLANQISNTISSSSKGTGVGNLFSETFDSVHVDALWFDELTKTLSSQIIEKSHDGYSSWSNISATKRHLYSSPIRISEDKKLNIIASIDHSGSVSTGDLQKIFSIFEQYSDRIAKLTVFHHTEAVIQHYTMEADEDIADCEEFKSAVANRSGSGGTSHLDCWRHIHKMDIQDPSEVIFLAFSDFYSDVECTINKYPIMLEIDKYWISDASGRDVNTAIAGGVNIKTP
ncbi:MAG: hypothetical protein U9N34_10260 [Candidatus Cloacimonadota bacterium]|nr:hypothetical protein [Candidatus Cloacimonadota bacterium]